MTQSLYAAIPLVMDRFDFEQVQKVMTFLDWKWSSVGIPTVDDLKAEAFRQLNKCIDEFERCGRPQSGMLIASGGFEATIQTFESGKPRLQLLFYVDSRSSTGEF